MPHIRRIENRDVERVATVLHDSGRLTDRQRIHYSIDTYPSALAVDQDGHLIGFAYCLGFAPDILELANIYVVPEWRNKQVGAALLEFIESIAGVADVKGIILVNSELYPSNEPKRLALAFYQRLGYVEVFSTDRSHVLVKRIDD